MLADNQPIAHPPKNTANVCRVVSPAWVNTAARMTAQTTAQPML
jgi:hypothetical protein